MTPESSAAAGGAETQFLDGAKRAGDLIAARRFAEAEAELVRAVAASPRDLRGLKLLALVRFKLGRLAEARAAYRSALEVAPDDAGVHFNLGLVAVKLEWWQEAVTELDAATRLAAGDVRAWTYLGYAHAQIGAVERAAEAFRRAGQTELARELERGARPASDAVAAAPARTRAAAPPTEPAPVAEAPADAAPVTPPGGPVSESAAAPGATDFALACLLPGLNRDAATAATAEKNGPVRAPTLATLCRFPFGHEAHVRESALLAVTGEVTMAVAHRRKQGRVTEEPLGSAADPFLKVQGGGEMWLAPMGLHGGLTSLALEQDALYVREDRVVAFEGDVAWESGRLPWDDLPLLQLRGSGRLVLRAAPDEVVAVPVGSGGRVTVARNRLIGWLGRVVTRSGSKEDGAGQRHFACEGEGMLLLSRHGELAQPVHERAEPGDDGAGAPGPGRPPVHR